MVTQDIRSKFHGEGVLPIGMRGTSYEMVVLLFETGLLTPNPGKKDEPYIYIWPVRKNWIANGLPKLDDCLEDYWDPVEWSAKFARTQAETDYFEARCGFSINDYEHMSRKRGFLTIERRVQAEMSSRGLTDADIEDIIAESKRRKGYRLEFHPDLVRDFQIDPDDWFHPDYTIALQVTCPDGIGSRYVSKIIPIGEYDAELLECYIRGKAIVGKKAGTNQGSR